MNRPDGASMLEAFAWRYRRRRLAAIIALALSIGAMAAAIVPFGPGGRLLAAVDGSVAAFALLYPILAQRQLDSAVMARHLDRTVPAMQESAGLLLIQEESLSFLGRVQRHRAAHALEEAVLPEFPDRAARRMLHCGLAFLAASILSLPIRARLAEMTGGERMTAWRAGAKRRREPAIRSVSIAIRPPAYTGHPPRQTTDWDLDVEAGAEVAWRVRLDAPADRMTFSLSDGATAPLKAEDGGLRWEGSLTASQPELYRVSISDTGSAAVRRLDRAWRPENIVRGGFRVAARTRGVHGPELPARRRRLELPPGRRRIGALLHDEQRPRRAGRSVTQGSDHRGSRG